MSLKHTVTCEGLLSVGIPVGEVQAFITNVLSAGSGNHEPVVVTIDKVKGGEDVVSLTVEISDETDEVLPPTEPEPEPAAGE